MDVTKDIDLALWRALQNSTTLISSGRLITNMNTKALAKETVLSIIREIDYDISKDYEDPKNSEDPEMMETKLEYLIDLMEDAFRQVRESDG